MIHHHYNFIVFALPGFLELDRPDDDVRFVVQLASGGGGSVWLGNLEDASCLARNHGKAEVALKKIHCKLLDNLI